MNGENHRIFRNYVSPSEIPQLFDEWIAFKTSVGSIKLSLGYSPLGSLWKPPTGNKKPASGLVHCTRSAESVVLILHPGPRQAPARPASGKATDLLQWQRVRNRLGQSKMSRSPLWVSNCLLFKTFVGPSKLNGQTSVFLALKVFSLMLMQEKFPSHSCNFIRQSGACPLLKKKRKTLFSFSEIVPP